MTRWWNMRRFVAYFWFNGWENFSIGFHVDISAPNIEIHVPFGFFRVGWLRASSEEEADTYRAFGYEGPTP